MGKIEDARADVVLLHFLHDPDLLPCQPIQLINKRAHRLPSPLTPACTSRGSLIFITTTRREGMTRERLSVRKIREILRLKEDLGLSNRAIGTGRAATATGADTLIRNVIRPTLASLFGEKIAQGVRLLYGGSVDAGNAGDFIGQPEIDGALVGGASLKARAFIDIVEAAQAYFLT